jgi:hypothetical protein
MSARRFVYQGYPLTTAKKLTAARGNVEERRFSAA